MLNGREAWNYGALPTIFYEIHGRLMIAMERGYPEIPVRCLMPLLSRCNRERKDQPSILIGAQELLRKVHEG